jgi:osmotically-inducible protein OsmY
VREVSTSTRSALHVREQVHHRRDPVDPRDRWRYNEIRGAALQALISDEQVPAERIDVAVDDGWLTLKGEVKHQYETDAAFDAARRLPGVGGIINEIKVITAGIDG